MRCQCCGIELKGGRGVYKWRCEVIALGEDVVFPVDESIESEDIKQKLFEQLKEMSAEQIEKDVYEQWEGLLCRSCRIELGEALKQFFSLGDD